MAPLKPQHLQRYRKAAEEILHVVQDPAHPRSDSLNNISEFKGMVTHVEFDESLSDKGRLAKGVIVLQ